MARRNLRVSLRSSGLQVMKDVAGTPETVLGDGIYICNWNFLCTCQDFEEDVGHPSHNAVQDCKVRGLLDPDYYHNCKASRVSLCQKVSVAFVAHPTNPFISEVHWMLPTGFEVLGSTPKVSLQWNRLQEAAPNDGYRWLRPKVCFEQGYID